jgi:hypothetical protein
MMSKIKPPSKIPGPLSGSGLQDLSASETNVRTGQSMLPPPSAGLKHKASGCKDKLTQEDYIEMLR